VVPLPRLRHRLQPARESAAEPVREAGLEGVMSELVLTRLRELAEPLVALSTAHLSPATRQLLQEDQLSVNAYPTPTGGFLYVGAPRYDTPLETDLAHLFELAESAGIVWLKFDMHGATVDGIERFDETRAET
jgi:hypothetical protein